MLNLEGTSFQLASNALTSTISLEDIVDWEPQGAENVALHIPIEHRGDVSLDSAIILDNPHNSLLGEAAFVCLLACPLMYANAT